MKGLSNDYEIAIDDSLRGMELPIDILDVDDDKLGALMRSRLDSFSSTKELFKMWQDGQNAPSQEKLKAKAKKLIKAGENSINVLRKALTKKTDYDELDAERYGLVAKSKPIIAKAIVEIDAGLISLRHQLEADILDFKEREFKRGFPEKFANQEFYPEKDYYKDWYDEKNDVIKIDPKGTYGEVIVLDNLKIALPVPPKNKKDILFSDLPIEEQYWRRIEPPKGLIPENENMYYDFIMEEFRKRREGVWFMNKGKPIWLCPAHYMGLQHNKMLDSGGYKEFRWAQCQMYYFTLACIIDTRCVGELFVKGRRTGFTEEIIDYLVNDSTSMKNALMGMTSKVGDDAQEAYLKYSYGIQNLPFYFQPVVKGKIDDLKKTEFGKVSDSSREAKKKKDTSTDDYLNTKVDWATSTTLAYDSKKLRRYLCDEAGKREKPQNIIDHWSNVKPTMVTGGRVVGKCFMGSTLNPRELGGKEFIELYYGSDVTKRNANGRTTTGLYSLFLPAHKNMEDYTDIYGYCHETVAPGEHFYNAQGVKMTIGSLQYLENEFKSAKQMGDKVYNNARRLDPITLNDAFRDESKGSIFNLEKINEQITHNDNTDVKDTLVRGNFSWKDGIKDTEVVWTPTSKGRFLIGWLPPKELQNRWTERNNQFGGRSKHPLNEDLGCFGADTYDIDATAGAKLENTENGSEYDSGSKGAISGVTSFSMKNIPSNFFFLEYIARPQSAEIFFEDALMACVFYGMPILIESNKARMLYHFKNRGYRGFSLTRFDKETNRLSPTEKLLGGIPSNSPDVIQMHWTAIEAYINKYVGYYEQGDDLHPIREENEIGSMPFNRTLRDWAQFNIAKRTEYDISIASGYALIGVNRKSYKAQLPERKTLDFKIRSYSK